MTKKRSLKSFSFQNKYGWMNTMKGPKWKRLLNSYSKEYETYANKEPIQTLTKQFQEELLHQPSYTTPTTVDNVVYEMVGGQALRWKMKSDDTDVFYFASDIDVDGDNVWTVEDNSSGSEQYTAKKYTKGALVWSYPKKVGQFVAVAGDRCYCIEVENFLWLRRLISVNKETGKDRRVELDIKDPGWNLQLVKGVNGCLFVQANNAGVQRCWYRTMQGDLKELEGYESFIPVGFVDKKVCFLGRKANSDSYEAINCGKSISLHNETPEALDLSRQILITKRFGIRTVWSLNNKKIMSVLGNIDIDPLPSWKGEQASITIAEPGSYRQSYEAYKDKTKVCSYAKATHFFTKSKDGTSVPYILVSSCKPKHLLSIVYGAYGAPTRMSTDRWKPLLDRGWAICFALVRGGGDHTDAWAEDARRENKIKSVEDFEACILAVQKKVHLSSKETFVYGRSAGGYTVGATLARHADGSLFTGVYTEVPYVDVFNTTSNPTLPLTRLEYNEFGNPDRLPNAQTLLSLSPIDSLPPSGAPSIFVLTRTGLNDKEVYAYESVKWITRLKELEQVPSAPKLLAFQEKEGHFAPENTKDSERSRDLAFLHSWLQRNKKSHLGIYKMANTRRNNASRKRRNNVASRKRRNNVTARKNNVVGGKRRKASGTRRRRTTHRK